MLKKLRCRRLARAPNVNHAAEREHCINNILHRSERHCVSQIRMKPIAFHKLCNILIERELIWQTAHVSIRKQILMFLHIIVHNVRFHVVGCRFHKLIEIVHRYFRIVLKKGF